jgi:HSP20 family molecular chaperone IbpA
MPPGVGGTLSQTRIKGGFMNSTTIAEAMARRSATPLSPIDPKKLLGEIQQIQLAIARRAYEIFETRNRERGRDWENWFQAESELLRPVSAAVAESPDGFRIRANVVGFSAAEVQIGIEPTRIIILAKNPGPLAAPANFSARRMLKLIELPSEIDPAGAVVEFQCGILRFELPKLAGMRAKSAAAGKS